MRIVKLAERQEFATFIKFMRKSVGWTAAELARQLGMTRSQINNYETCRNLPRNRDDVEKRIREVVKKEIRRRRMEEAYDLGKRFTGTQRSARKWVN